MENVNSVQQKARVRNDIQLNSKSTQNFFQHVGKKIMKPTCKKTLNVI